jgi:hypothetical protein
MFGVMVVDVVVLPSLHETPMLPLGTSSLFRDSESLADAANLLEAVASEPDDCPCAASSAFIVSGERP